MWKSFKEYLADRKSVLDKAFREHLAAAIGNVALKEASLAGTLESGKKIRGGLACLINEVLGGTLDSAIPRAVAVELIQTATLMHDDFVDQDTIRRNRPAAWTLEGARRAVLMGDVIFATAIKMMNDLGHEDGAVVSQAIAQIALGALHEPLDAAMLAREIDSRPSSNRFYEKIIHLKTGVLFAAGCRLGAIAAKAEGRFKENAYQYGLCVGEAYQIADDLQDLKQGLARRSLPLQQILTLGPALFRFAENARPQVLALIGGKDGGLDDGVLPVLQAVIQRMEQAMEERLRAALARMETGFPDNVCSRLARKAPWEMIRLLNQS